MTTTEEWLEAQADRVLARQRAAVDTTKLVSTFATGVAGAVVASALQTGTETSAWDWVASWSLAGAFLLTVAVIVADRLKEPDHSRVLESAALGRWGQGRTLFELRQAALWATYSNEGNVRTVRALMWLQLLASVFTGSAAAYSMLSGQGGS
ncbi:hypothetical protein [Blastococcus aurantiacus]|uniref:hypothetical protein n=1 Tax=Blastococcus aurantiacus TaxID=1550231 RepID=UPI00115F8F8F|nr:hypothetical protein [Blastococcus aurantiacus]